MNNTYKPGKIDLSTKSTRLIPKAGRGMLPRLKRLRLLRVAA